MSDTSTPTPTPRTVPPELRRLVGNLLRREEESLRTATDNDEVSGPAAHTYMIGYYSGILTMLAIAGYADPNDPFLTRVDTARRTHATDRWPTFKGDPPQ